MVKKLRERSRGEGGFTLVELLVVMLILGLLAAIAIPSFFNQRDKARDADAKSSARTAQTAMETYATDNQGSYADSTGAGFTTIEAALLTIEPTLADAPNPVDVTVNNAGDYSLEVDSDTGNTFTITRNAGGTTDLTCSTAGQDGCPQSGTWG